jgi:hypothetical protein
LLASNEMKANRRAKAAHKLYVTACWLLGAGWLAVTLASFVNLRPQAAVREVTKAEGNPEAKCETWSSDGKCEQWVVDLAEKAQQAQKVDPEVPARSVATSDREWLLQWALASGLAAIPLVVLVLARRWLRWLGD